MTPPTIMSLPSGERIVRTYVIVSEVPHYGRVRVPGRARLHAAGHIESLRLPDGDGAKPAAQIAVYWYVPAEPGPDAVRVVLIAAELPDRERYDQRTIDATPVDASVAGDAALRVHDLGVLGDGLPLLGRALSQNCCTFKGVKPTRAAQIMMNIRDMWGRLTEGARFHFDGRRWRSANVRRRRLSDLLVLLLLAAALGGLPWWERLLPSWLRTPRVLQSERTVAGSVS